jgi:hypothetical protein
MSRFIGFQANVRHEGTQDGMGIFVTYATLEEAQTWVASWPDAVWAEIRDADGKTYPAPLAKDKETR